ncbi:MAG: ATP-binding cassette domain-containing protein [Sphingobacteriaceae bacterium]
MEIVLENIGRRFNQEWIFRSVDFSFQSGHSYAILGPNGSGKSTLLQILAGSLSPSEGKITYRDKDLILDPDEVFSQLALAAPYLELIEDFTLQEMIDFHFKFKTYLPGIYSEKIIEILNLQKAENKAIRYFSSGMKQRTKLALAVLSHTPILILDEPTANFDEQGIAWYQNLMTNYAANRLVIVGSNQENEYRFCTHKLHLPDYKRF